MYCNKSYMNMVLKYSFWLCVGSSLCTELTLCYAQQCCHIVLVLSVLYLMSCFHSTFMTADYTGVFLQKSLVSLQLKIHIEWYSFSLFSSTLLEIIAAASSSADTASVVISVQTYS